MEDFRHAYQERLQDKTLLESADRRTAAMHLGGVTIECLLKAMRVEIDHISDWHIPGEKCPTCKAAVRPGHLQHHGIENPGHHLFIAIQRWPRLMQRITKMDRAQRDSFIRWIRLLETPTCHYIDLRYTCDSPSDAEFQQWQEAFKRTHAWLQAQDNNLRQVR
jgi:hypothetical protein